MTRTVVFLENVPSLWAKFCLSYFLIVFDDKLYMPEPQLQPFL